MSAAGGHGRMVARARRREGDRESASEKRPLFVRKCNFANRAFRCVITHAEDQCRAALWCVPAAAARLGGWERRETGSARRDEACRLTVPRLLHAFPQVDDDPFVCMVVEQLLTTKGWEVVSCATGEECLEKLEREAFAAEPFAAVRPTLRQPRPARNAQSSCCSLCVVLPLAFLRAAAAAARL